MAGPRRGGRRTGSAGSGDDLLYPLDAAPSTMAKVVKKQTAGERRQATGDADVRTRRRIDASTALRVGPDSPDGRLPPVAGWPQVWLWPLLGALLLAPLRAGQLDRVPVAA